MIDADRIVRDLQAPGQPVFRAIVARFGPAVVSAAGTLDRAALRARVFGNPESLAALNAIVHPAVKAERDRLEAEAAGRGAAIVVNDIPLLFETGDPGGFDAVVLVDAPEPIRLERLMSTRGLDRATALAMIAAQSPSGPKRARSTYVIDNDGEVATLERRARAVWDQLEALARRPRSST